MGDSADIHSNLKLRTRPFHEALETKLRFLLSDAISLDQYKALQKKFYGFYRPIEWRLLSVAGLDEDGLQLQARAKLPLLIDDMIYLSVGSDDIAGLPSCESLPRLGSVSEALGCLYVLEGSTLGGRIITGHIKKVLPLDEKRGCSFFNSYGSDVGRMWSSFLRALSLHCERHGEIDAVVNAACQTFSALDRWISNDE
jgi:heme oxygenase